MATEFVTGIDFVSEGQAAILFMSPPAGWLAGTFICLLSAAHLNFGPNIRWKKCKMDLERQEGGWKT